LTRIIADSRLNLFLLYLTLFIVLS